MKQIIITLIAWTTIVLSVSATGQEGEQLFWKGANYQMLTCPLYDCHAFDKLGKKLEEECYENMFRNCTSLLSSPIFPESISREDIVKAKSFGMFAGCNADIQDFFATQTV